mgnify:CR=1 FL=1
MCSPFIYCGLPPGRLRGEGMLEHLDARLPVLDVDSHHVEAAGAVQYPLSHKKVERDSDNLLLLARRDRREAPSVSIAGPRLDFDEHQRPRSAGNDVDLTTPSAVATRKNRVPTTRQLVARELLPQFPERLPSICTHGQERVQGPRLSPAPAS